MQKVQKLQADLQALGSADDSEGKESKHVIFVDDDKQVAEFDPAKHFDTAPGQLLLLLAVVCFLIVIVIVCCVVVCRACRPGVQPAAHRRAEAGADHHLGRRGNLIF